MERFGVPRGKRPRVQVSMDDKERAIARIRSGETKAGISRELGVPESTVRGWVKRAEQRFAREAAGQQSSANSYSSILAMAMAKPQLTITNSKPNSISSSPPLALQSLKLPQKRNNNGVAVPRPVQASPHQKPVETAAPVPVVPVPMAFPVPSFDLADSQLQVIGWLHIFNAGILNFTLIATAALLQARSRGLADRLPLWQIIADFVDEAGRNVVANGGSYVVASPPSSNHRVERPTSPRHRQVHHQYRNKFVAARVHITAEDDEDCSTEAEI
ncbi:hypothetical protein KR009_008340 [Drosophila setifemur]|nr:hypothetical protein KR009_008340 [Drosophila setifemur]